MANYERKILIPYLQNVCSMEMACVRIRRNIQYYESQIKKTNQNIQICTTAPSKPVEKDYRRHKSVNVVISIVLSILIVVIEFCMLLSSRSLILGLIIFLVPIMVLSIFHARTISLIQETREDKKEYQAAQKRYEQGVRIFESNQQKLPQIKQRLATEQKLLDAQKRQLTQARSTLQRLYSVNIIPNRYRNIHVAYYLYDYFSSTRETDLDKIVQTMLLDEIIQRLDRIIAQQEEIILNQRIQIARQDQQNQMIAENHRQEMRRLARMEHNQERQADYLQMIDRNQEVTNFFLAVDFFSKK